MKKSHTSTRNRIIAIEGLNFSGKTTISSTLAKDNYLRIPEVEEFVLNLYERDYLDADIKRSSLALELSKEKNVVMDRSIISSFVYTLAHDKVYNTNLSKGLLDIVSKISRLEIIVPWIVYLNLNLETMFKRVSETDDRDTGFLLNKKFYIAQKEIFDQLRMENQSLFLEIDAEMEQSKIIHTIDQWINRKVKQPSLKDFQNMLKYLKNRL